MSGQPSLTDLTLIYCIFSTLIVNTFIKPEYMKCQFPGAKICKDTKSLIDLSSTSNRISVLSPLGLRFYVFSEDSQGHCKQLRIISLRSVRYTPRLTIKKPLAGWSCYQRAPRDCPWETRGAVSMGEWHHDSKETCLVEQNLDVFFHKRK